MQKLLLPLLLTALLLSACVPAQADAPLVPGPGDLQREEAIRIATEQFLETCGFERDALTDFQVEADLWELYANPGESVPRTWYVTFTYLKSDGLSCLVRVASPSGTVMNAEPQDYARQLADYKQEMAEQDIAMAQGEKWISEKGAWELWSYQDKADFYAQYGRHPGTGIQMSAIGLPQEGDVPLEQAIVAAKDAIIAHFGETGQKVDKFIADCTLYLHFLRADGSSGRMWVIAFRDASILSGDMHAMAYQANVLPESGKVDRIYQRELTAAAGEEQDSNVWPPYPEPTAAPVVVEGGIFYNPKGGKYYHSDPRCPSVKEDYLPLTLIDRSRMDDPEYRYLLPCPRCIGTAQK